MGLFKRKTQLGAQRNPRVGICPFKALVLLSGLVGDIILSPRLCEAAAGHSLVGAGHSPTPLFFSCLSLTE